MRIGAIVRGYNLTTPLEVKVEDAAEFGGWTVFC
jgi:hypothetical protein